MADLLNVAVPPNKAIVGENAFSHSAGIHVDGVLKMRETYEIMKPEEVGFQTSRIILTARTGRHGLKHRLEELGLALSNAEIETVYRRFLVMADQTRVVFDKDLIAIAREEMYKEVNQNGRSKHKVGRREISSDGAVQGRE